MGPARKPIKCLGLPSSKCKARFIPRNIDHKRCSECAPEWNRLRRNAYARKNRHRFKKPHLAKPTPGDDDIETVSAYKIHRLMLRMADV